MKKRKKEKPVVEELVLGEKIRDVKINERQHFLLYVSMLVLFNLVMLASVWLVLIYLTRWYNWLICVILLAVAFGLSFKNYRETKIFHRCTLYNNALVINSIWFNLEVPLKDICEINVKETSLDRIFKLNTKSLEIKILRHRRKKFTIHFVEENPIKLKQEITMLIDRDEEQTTKSVEKKSKSTKKAST